MPVPWMICSRSPFVQIVLASPPIVGQPACFQSEFTGENYPINPSSHILTDAGERIKHCLGNQRAFYANILLLHGTEEIEV